jgi:hypothetical protein
MAIFPLESPIYNTPSSREGSPATVISFFPLASTAAEIGIGASIVSGASATRCVVVLCISTWTSYVPGSGARS